MSRVSSSVAAILRGLCLLCGGLWASSAAGDDAAPPRQVSGIYPHLAMFNDEGECGTGAVVPWAGRLWVITYGPHLPLGSSDKLYEITPDLRQIVRPESVGGTHANRMIHRETGQLLIGPYVIDAKGSVRVIPPPEMPGRLTGTARHLTDPAGKAYYATMEEGLYEVDLRTLQVTGLIRDGNNLKAGQTRLERPAEIDSQLPGYHGKGLYTGQGRLVYSNNGEHGERALVDPTIYSGALAEWRGAGDWSLVRRNQFTEVTGPGGIAGNENPESDPLWAVGWDARSVILMVRDEGQWRTYRLPKASHCYDGAHGWNTEWPRIRDIGEDDLLMTMHGTLWRFPRGFRPASSAGIAPRSTHLKVIGDFCRWQDRVVFGCDDTARSEFLNKRKAKGGIAGPGQSQSNLWFVEPERLDDFGPALGRGAVWLGDAVKGDEPSDPYLFSGYARRGVHLAHGAETPVGFAIEVDPRGDGTWRPVRMETVPAGGCAWVEFPPEETGAWVRVRVDRDCPSATAVFHYSNPDPRGTQPDPVFAGLAEPDDADVSGGLVYARGANLRTLRFAARTGSKELGCYDLDAELNLRRVDDPQGLAWAQKNFAVPRGVLTVDAASVLLVDEQGRRWRLPKGDPAFDAPDVLGPERICREVCTERDLLNCHGTFYELPAENAGGLAKVRPIATHNRRISDYCSWRGLIVLSGVAGDAPDSPHIVRSDDGRCALWVGVVDDLWRLGKPRGTGGPWNETPVRAGEPSDPYLMTGYDRKRLMLTHTAEEPVTFRVEIDIAGTGSWHTYREFAVPAGEPMEHAFPEGFAAYWVRIVSDRDATATATLVYE